MVTISLSNHIQAQGTLVRLDGLTAYINQDGRLISGLLLTPREKLPACARTGDA